MRNKIMFLPFHLFWKLISGNLLYSLFLFSPIFSCFAKIRWMPSWFAKLLELLSQVEWPRWSTLKVHGPRWECKNSLRIYDAFHSFKNIQSGLWFSTNSIYTKYVRKRSGKFYSVQKIIIRCSLCSNYNAQFNTISKTANLSYNIYFNNIMIIWKYLNSDMNQTVPFLYPTIFIKDK
jgi:hypothetical protein